MVATRRFAAENPVVWGDLLDRLLGATTHFLKTLIGAGADAYQLFDSWAGMLDEEEYRRWAQPYHESVLQEATGVPRILFVKECPYLSLLTSTGADVISLGACHDLALARRNFPNISFQGNVNEEVLRNGTPAEVAAATKACVRAGGGRRHIVNLNHGVDRGTPVANFEAYVAAVKSNQ